MTKNTKTSILVILVLALGVILGKPLINFFRRYKPGNPKHTNLLISQLRGGKCYWGMDGKTVSSLALSGYCEESAAFLLGEGGPANRAAVPSLINALNPSDYQTNSTIMRSICDIIGQNQFTKKELLAWTDQKINLVMQYQDSDPNAKDILTRIKNHE